MTIVAWDHDMESEMGQTYFQVLPNWSEGLRWGLWVQMASVNINLGADFGLGFISSLSWKDPSEMGKVNKARELFILFMTVRDMWAVLGTWELQEHLL